jgi:hypothetical protein
MIFIIEYTKSKHFDQSINNVINCINNNNTNNSMLDYDDTEIDDSINMLEDSSSDSSPDETLDDLYEIISEDDNTFYCTYCNGNFDKNSGHSSSKEHKERIKNFEVVYHFDEFFSVDAQQRNDLLNNKWLSNSVIECYLFCTLSNVFILRN